MNASEKALYKEKDHEKEKEKLAVPWKDIVTSIPVWALVITHTLSNVGWYMFLVELPLFMRSGLGLNIKQVYVI